MHKTVFDNDQQITFITILFVLFKLLVLAVNRLLQVFERIFNTHSLIHKHSIWTIQHAQMYAAHAFG